MDTVRRLVWFAIVASAVAFAVFAVLGNFVSAGAGSSGPVAIRDVVTPGTHYLSGMLLLPYQCDELSVQTQELSSNEYELVFQTWQDPSVACPQTPTPRSFQTVAFAPSVGTTFVATLDGNSFPIVIIPDTATSAPGL